MRFRYVLPVVLSAAAGIPAHADITITPKFDPSISGDLTAVASIEKAIGFIESTYATPINVTIDFEAMASGLGKSQFGFYDLTYQTFYDALVHTRANLEAISGLTRNGGNAANNPVNGTSLIEVKPANGRALGFPTPGLCNVIGSAGSLQCSSTLGGPNAIDGIIGLNTSMTSPPNALPGNFDLTAVTEHEIDEVLGLGSALPNCPPPKGCTSVSAANPAPEDLFRFTAPGVFASLNVRCSALTPAYFDAVFYSGSNDSIKFNTACNGGDWGDWDSSGHVQDAFANAGVNIPYGQVERDAMSAIGYTVNGLQVLPEPRAWVLMLSLIGVLSFAKRRLRA